MTRQGVARGADGRGSRWSGGGDRGGRVGQAVPDLKISVSTPGGCTQCQLSLRKNNLRESWTPNDADLFHGSGLMVKWFCIRLVSGG
jgi:hypothetical protein